MTLMGVTSVMRSLEREALYIWLSITKKAALLVSMQLLSFAHSCDGSCTGEPVLLPSQSRTLF